MKHVFLINPMPLIQYSSSMRAFILALLIMLSWVAMTDSARAEYTRITTLAPIKEALDKADKDTLVLFDVDNVLITPRDQIFTSAYNDKLDTYYKEMTARVPTTQQKELWEMVSYKVPQELVDPGMPALINDLKRKKIKTVALTSARTGKIETIERFEDWRAQELSQFGIDFSSSFPMDNITLGEPQKKYGSPLFKKGIIFTARQDKGEILKNFLNLVKFKPSKIIFVDDHRSNLESVEKACGELGITCEGIYYKAVDDRQVKPLNEERVKLQFEILGKEHRWIGDKEAEALLARRTRAKAA